MRKILLKSAFRIGFEGKRAEPITAVPGSG
jgi:hypothetical protein